MKTSTIIIILLAFGINYVLFRALSEENAMKKNKESMSKDIHCDYEGFECPHAELHKLEIPQLKAIGLDIDTVSHKLLISTEEDINAYDNLTPEEFQNRYGIRISWCKEHILANE